MTLFLLLLAAGVAPAQTVGFQVPRYRLTPGTKIWCTGVREVKHSRGTSHGTRSREHWVLSDSGGVYKVLMRVVDQGHKIDTAGKRTDDTVEIGWELFEMTPNGELLRDQSTADIDVSGFFPLLPDDSTAAANGWTQVSTSGPLPSRYSFRLDNRSVSDSLWLVDRTSSTPLDAVYGLPAEKQRSVIDTRRGLPLRRESGHADTATNWEAWGSITLDSVTKFDAAGLEPRLRDVISYFDAKMAYEEAGANAERDDTSGIAAAGRRGLAILKDALRGTNDSTVNAMLSRDIEQHEEGIQSFLSDVREQLQRRGKPAPNWELADLDGKKHALKDYRGKVLVLDWWYKGCPWCILAMPALTEVAQRYADRPVVILGMNVDQNPDDARFVVEKCRPGYSSLLAGRELARDFGVKAYPTLVIIDAEGKIADVHIGYAKDLAALLSKKLDAMLKP